MNAAGDESASAVPAAFPWDAVLHTGLARLRLDPAAFWRLSPREFAALCGAHRPHDRAPLRGDLADLMRRFPDEMQNEGQA